MDVVISGIGGRFPRSNNVKEFSDNLLAGNSLLEPPALWPQGALDTPKFFGQTHSYSKFDYTFFGVHYDLAKSSDPMMRLAIETAFEAVVDAGICPTTIRGTNAQYAATSQAEGDCFFNNMSNMFGYVIMGRNRSNRISQVFNLSGRSCAYDASISWVGTGLDLARQAILSGECDTVFVNNCSMMALAEISKQKQMLGLLSPDSTTHPYDVDRTWKFLDHISMHGVTQESVTNASVEIKQKVLSYVESGLKNGIVVPLPATRECSANTNGFSLSRTSNGREVNEFYKEVPTPILSQESRKQSCMVVGSPAQWIRLAYCLARKGYKLIALVSGKQSSNLLNRHSRILRTEYATELKALQSVNPSQTSEIGFVNDIFVFDRANFAEDVSRVLDSRSLGDTRVTFFSAGSTQFSRKCERWNRDGLKVRAALGVKDVPIDTVGPYLDWILSSAAPAVSVLDRSSFSVVNSQDKSLSETGFLPTSVAESRILGSLIRSTSSPIFRKLVTRNSVRRSCEVNPLFFIKGVHGTATSDLTTLGTSLLGPLCEVTLPADCSSLEAVAQHIVQGIQRIQSRGPYNLAGDPIRTNVVMRAARILEDNGFASVVFVMAEELETVRSGLSLLREENRLGVSLLKSSLGGSLDPQDWKTVQWSLLTWVEQVQVAVPKLTCSDPNIREDITAALHHMYNSVLHIIETKEDFTLEHGIVHLLMEGDKPTECRTEDRLYKRFTPPYKVNSKDIAEIFSSNLATPCLQLETDRVRRTGLRD